MHQQGPSRCVAVTPDHTVDDCAAACLQHPLDENTWARVKTFAEIERTLDSQGRTEGLPFMPEMLTFCGRAFRVRKPANICLGGFRRVARVWHLEGPRCSGVAHGGCQAKCLLYWHESWLEPAFSTPSAESPQEPRRNATEVLHCFDATTNRFKCQLTEASRIGTVLPEPTLREHLNNYFGGRLNWSDLRILAAYSYSRALFGFFRRVNWPVRSGDLSESELHIGDIVRVRSRAAIIRTLNREGSHKGLSLRPDMLRFCGRMFRVTACVDRIIDEYTGELRHIKNGCYILDGVTCAGEWKLCTREEFYYWRSIWLEKVASASTSAQSAA